MDAAGADDQKMGDQYVFVGMDVDTKFVISHLVGKRDASSTCYFMRPDGFSSQQTGISLTEQMSRAGLAVM